MKRTRLKTHLLRELLERYRWRDLIRARYRFTSSRKDRVRCSEVAAALADQLGIALSPGTRIRIRQAAALGGWRLVVSWHHVAMYTNMVRR